MRELALGGLLLLVVLVAGPGSALGDETYELNEADAKELVSKAASASARFLNTIIALGGKFTSKDLLAEKADVPLTIVVLVMGGAELDDRDLKLLPGATPKAFAEAINPEEVRAGQRVPKHPYASLIHDEYVQDISVKVNGRTATGGVRFRAPGAYEGYLEYTAFRDAAGWRVLELSFPHSQVRTVLESGRWRLRMPAAMATPKLRRDKQLDLPRVGTVGSLPETDTRVVITVTRAGWIRVPGVSKPVSLMELQRWLRAKAANPRLRNPDGTSRIDALLDVDRTIPWVITQWIMQTCAHPQIKIFKIWLGAETKGGKGGAIATVLPKDRGLAPGRPRPVEFIKHKLKVYKLTRVQKPSDMRGVYAALKARHEEVGKRPGTVFEIVAPPPKGSQVPHGYIVQLVDVCLAVGAHDIVFEGAPMPRRSAMAGSAELLKRHIDVLRKTPGVPVVRLNNDPTILPPASKDLAALPARGLLEQRWGTGLTMAVEMIAEDLEETEEEVEERDGEAARKDEPFKDEPLKDGGLEDVPFQGPGGNARIGIGGGAGGAFHGRGGGARGKQLSDTEVKRLWARQDAAVDGALRWLAAHQSPNGSWEANGFGNWCDGRPVRDVSKKPQGLGKPLYDVGVSGLALQAFLGAGYTNRGRHPFAKVVSRGLRFLKNVQDPEGCFGPRSTQQYIYNHAAAAAAMVEAYGMTGSPIFKGSAQRSLDFIALARNPYFAWRYGIKPGDNDTSVTGWMVHVLHAAKLINDDAKRRGKPAPLTIDESAFDGAKAWLDKVTDPKTGRVGYVQRGTGPARPQELVDRFPGKMSESMTAVAVLARIYAGQDPHKTKVVARGLALIAKKPPAWDLKTGRIDMYYWQWGTLAMFQAGGKAFATWRRRMGTGIVDRQRRDGDYCQYKGSWDPVGPWGLDGGRVYSTAMMALCLEVRYRYSRIFR